MLFSKQPLRIPVRGREDDPSAPIFLMRMPTLDERTLFEAELAGPPWNAGVVYGFQLAEQLDAAAEALAANADDLARVREVLHFARHDPDALDDGARALLAAFQEAAAEHWPGYQALLRKQERRRLAAPALALRRFLIGWENIDTPFEIEPTGCVSDATLESLSEMERFWLGHEIHARMYVSAERGKASAPPSSSPAGPATSEADGDHRTAGRDGKSATTSGKKTRR